jgi:transcriptional regulator with XRE-family HTH domain
MTLKAHRLAASLSQGELGDRIGVRQGTIYKIESGHRRPSLPMLVALADALGLDDCEAGALARSLMQNGEG